MAAAAPARNPPCSSRNSSFTRFAGVSRGSCVGWMRTKSALGCCFAAAMRFDGDSRAGGHDDVVATVGKVGDIGCPVAGIDRFDEVDAIKQAVRLGILQSPAMLAAQFRYSTPP